MRTCSLQALVLGSGPRKSRCTLSIGHLAWYSVKGCRGAGLTLLFIELQIPHVLTYLRINLPNQPSCFLNINRPPWIPFFVDFRENIKSPADKGRPVVVWNTTDYIVERTRQLANAIYYCKLNSDPIKKYNKRISDRLELGVISGDIDSDTAKRLIVPYSVPGRFYILQKIHKKGIPGRPIFSGNGCPTEIIPLFVDYHLKDLVRLVPLYFQYDMDFLRKIHNINAVGPLPPDIILCTMDVSALYTNIPHGEGIGACKSALEKLHSLIHFPL
ncbi:hypothetical protein PoB_001815100 [Plakobranchus ocellatus]|uniref:Reverse transcriptase domain-containing protein n=1 Tax=Plakobranchus ocellatus TaxID=259542 RepID=A0AAV3ZAG0_9GAST|nr:hypothetical protein PoB_001815100 [Plakobranchus ocellatus]